MARTGNGIDIGAVYQLLTEVAARLDRQQTALDDHGQKLNDVIGVVNEHTRRFDQAAAILNRHERKLDNLYAGLRDLRETVNLYHQAVLGHGFALTRLEDRVMLIEEHLRLDPAPT